MSATSASTIWEDVLRVGLVVTALLGLFAVYLVAKLTGHPAPPRGRLANHVKSLRSGDLLIMPYSGLYSWLVRIYGGTFWTHCSIVLREGPRDEDVKIMEIAYYEDEDDLVEDPGGSGKTVPRVYKNVFMLPIEKWRALNARRGVVGVIHRAEVGDEAAERNVTERLRRAFQAQSHAKINLDPMTWLTTIAKLPYRASDAAPRDRVFCTELAAKILQDSGMIAKKHRPECYRPADFATLPEFENGIYILSLTKGRQALSQPSVEGDELCRVATARSADICSDFGAADICGVRKFEVVGREGGEGHEAAKGDKGQVAQVENLKVQVV